MKSLFLTIFAIISGIGVYAQGPYNVVVFTEDGSSFTLYLNNIQQHETPESNVWVGGLIAPMYRAKLVFDNPNKPVLEKNLLMPEVSSEITYRVIEKKGKLKMRMYSVTPFPPVHQVLPDQRSVTLITTPVYTETTTTTVIQNGNSDNVNVGVNVDGVGVGINVNVNQGNGGVVYQETTTTTTTVQNGDHYVMQGYGGPIGCPWPMDPADFQSALATINSKTFDDTRLNLAKQIVASNCLFADQVRDITGLLEFEDTKLQFAKFAYGYTYDIGNYFKVSQVFDFESSVDELNEFIGGY